MYTSHPNKCAFICVTVKKLKTINDVKNWLLLHQTCITNKIPYLPLSLSLSPLSRYIVRGKETIIKIDLCM